MCTHVSSPAYEWEYVVFHFLFLCQFAEDDVLQIHPCPYKRHELIISDCCIIFHGVYVPHLLIFYLVICFLTIELFELLMYFGYKSLIRCMVLKYFLPLCGLSIHSVGFFVIHFFFQFNVIILCIFTIVTWAFKVISKTSLIKTMSWNIFSMFSSGSFMFWGFTLNL